MTESRQPKRGLASLLHVSVQPWRGRRGLAAVLGIISVCYLLLWQTVSSGTTYDSFVLVNALINVMLVMSLFLIFGLSGQISIGHAAFFGIGAYASGYLASMHGLAFPWTVLASAAAGALAGLLLIPLSRLEVHYFVMTTLGLGLVLYSQFGARTGITGGWSGMPDIPGLGEIAGIDLSTPLWSATVVFGFVSVEFLLLRVLVLGRAGRTFRAIRDDRLAARSLGMRVTASKAEAAVLGCTIAGVAGSLAAHINGFVSPQSFGLLPSTMLVLAVVVGGTGSLIGAVIAGLGMPYVSEMLSPWPDISPLIYGSVIVLIMLFSPTGLAGLWRSGVELVGRWTGLADPAVVDGSSAVCEDEVVLGRIAASLSGPPGGGHSEADCPILCADGVSKYFGGVTAVDNASLAVQKGTVHGIIGPNGAGKSSLFNILTGVTPPDGGTVRFRGVDVTGSSTDGLARRGLVRTFQNGRLFTTMTVRENIQAAVGPNRRFVALSTYCRPRRTLQEEAAAAILVRDVIDLVGLSGVADLVVEQLAYGQRRLVEVARAVAARPTVLLLDEPAAGLASADRRSFIDLIRRLRCAGFTVVIVEHDLALINAICDQVTVLHEGRDLATDTPDEVLADPEVRAAYMGRSSHTKEVN